MGTGPGRVGGGGEKRERDRKSEKGRRKGI